MGVLRMMVAMTKVTARVSKPNNSPRKRRKRNTTAPKPTPNKAGTKAAMGKV